MRLFIRFEREQTERLPKIDATIVVDDKRNNPDDVFQISQSSSIDSTSAVPKAIVREVVLTLQQYLPEKE